MNKFHMHSSWIWADQWLPQLNYTSRHGESRFGDVLHLRSSSNQNWKSRKYHLLGVEESVGPQLNLGRPGAENAFAAFMERFLIMQNNSFFAIDQLVFHGVFRLQDELSTKAIQELDKNIEDWTSEVVLNGGIPILVGGGHNTALGLIEGVHAALNQPISVLNIDAHADLRTTESRHSGNSFSKAFESMALQQYFLFGAQKAFNNTHILNVLNNRTTEVCWLDDILLKHHSNDEAFRLFIHDMDTEKIGVELDMDVIAYMPSSALSPSGFSVNEIRRMLMELKQVKQIHYYNFTEAAPQTTEERIIVGKALAYFVSDILRMN